MWPYVVSPSAHGYVVDAASRGPIAGAVVRIQEFPETAVRSANDGSFSIAAVRKWQRIVFGLDMQTSFGLAVDAPGYASVVQYFEIGGLPQQIVMMKRAAN